MVSHLPYPSLVVFSIITNKTCVKNIGYGHRNPDVLIPLEENLERLKWLLWHGNTLKALDILEYFEFDVVIPPKFSVSHVVRIIKSNTSKDLKRKFPFLKDVYWRTDGIWSDGYFASTVGINEEIIRNYIENQGKEDSGQAKLVLSRRPT